MEENEAFDPISKLKAHGYSEEDVSAWKEDATQKFKAHGYSDEDIAGYFQTPIPSEPVYAGAHFSKALQPQELTREQTKGFLDSQKLNAADQVPTHGDFSNATSALAGGSEYDQVQKNLLTLYNTRGLHPSNAAYEAHLDPLVYQSLLSDGPDEAEHYDDRRPGWGMLSEKERHAELTDRVKERANLSSKTQPSLEAALALRQRDEPIPPGRMAKLKNTGLSPYSNPKDVETFLNLTKKTIEDGAQFEQGMSAAPTKTSWRSAGENAIKSATDSVISIPEYVGIAKGYLQHWITGSDVEDEFLQRHAREAKDWAAAHFPGDQARQNDFLQQFASTSGMVAGLYGVGGLAKLSATGVAKLAGMSQAGMKAVGNVAQGAAMVGGGAAATGAQGFEEASQAMKGAEEAKQTREDVAKLPGVSFAQPAEPLPEGPSEAQRLAGTLGQTAVGGAMAVPIARAATAGLAGGSRVGRAAAAAIEQGAAFPVFGAAGNWVAQQTYSPDRSIWEGMWNQAGIGLAMGFLTGFVSPGAPKPLRARDYTPEQLGAMMADNPSMAQDYKRLAQATIDHGPDMPPLTSDVRNDLQYILDQIDPKLAKDFFHATLPGSVDNPHPDQQVPAPGAALDPIAKLEADLQSEVGNILPKSWALKVAPGEIQGEGPYSFGGTEAKAPPPGRAEAEKLEAAGTPKEEIWERTGWHKSPTGEWRFEIDDSKATIDEKFIEHNNQEGRDGDIIIASDVTIGDVLKHDELFKQYPEMKDIPVIVSIGEHFTNYGGGRYNPAAEGLGGKTTTKISAIVKNYDELKSTLIHELQHHIQGQQPDKVPYGNWYGTQNSRRHPQYMDMANEIMKEIPGLTRSTAEGGMKIDDARAALDWLIYYHDKYEIESREAQYRLGMTEAERKEIPPFPTRESLTTEGEKKGIRGSRLSKEEETKIHDIVIKHLGTETFDIEGYKSRSEEAKARTVEARAKVEAETKAKADAEAKAKAEAEAKAKAEAEAKEAARKAEEARQAKLAAEREKAEQEATRTEAAAKRAEEVLRRMQETYDRLTAEYNAAHEKAAKAEEAERAAAEAAKEAEKKFKDAESALSKASRDEELMRAHLDRAEAYAKELEGLRRVRAERENQAHRQITAQGMADPKARIAWISAMALDPSLVAREESGHALKASGLFKPEEWETLVKAAKDGKWVDAIPADIRAKYAEAYLSKGPEGIYDAMVEEAIMRKFSEGPGAWGPQGGAAYRFFQRIQELLERIGAWMRGKGFQTSEDVFQAMNSGEVARRDTGEVHPERKDVAAYEGGGGGRDVGPPGGAGAGGAGEPRQYSNAEIEQARRDILSRISIGEPDRGRGYSLEQLYKNFIDQYYYIGKAVKQVVGESASSQAMPTEDNPYHRVRMYPGKDGKITHILEHGTIDWDTLEKNGKGLKEILEPVKNDLDGLRAFMVAARNIEKMSQGKATGVDPAASVIYGAAASARYGQVMLDLIGFQNRMLDYLVKSGIVSESSRAAMTEANKFYNPWHRVFGPDEHEGWLSSSMGGGQNLTPRDPIKKFKGSERRIIDPLETIVKNVFTFVEMAERNVISDKLVGMLEHAQTEAEIAYAKAHQEQDKLTVEPTDVDFTTPPEKGLPGGDKKLEGPPPEPGLPAPYPYEKATELLPTDITPADREAAADYLKRQGLEPDEALIDMVAAEAKGHVQQGTIAVYREGKRRLYRVDHELSTAIKGLDAVTVGSIEKLLSIPASTLRGGAVATPEFALRHLFRSLFYTGVTMKNGIYNPKDIAMSMFGLAFKTEKYWEWMKSGGANVWTGALDRDALQEKLDHLTDKTGLATRAINVVIDPETSWLQKGGAIMGLPPKYFTRYIMHPLQVLTEFSENVGHFAGFQKEMAAIEKTGLGETSDTQDTDYKRKVLRAGWASRETGVDTRRIGAQMRAFNMITAFSNIVFQDTDRVARAIKEDPVNTMMKIAVGIALPSALLWYANKDRDEYKDLPEWQKRHFWHVYVDRKDGKVYDFRLPKPFSAGVLFGSGMEATLDRFFGDNPEAFKGFTSSMAEASIPHFIPQALIPPMEQFANRSTFFNKHLIPKSMEKFLPEYQYTEHTTPIARALAQTIAAIPGVREASLPESAGVIGSAAKAVTSPILLENYIRGWTGGLGRHAIEVLDYAARQSGVVKPQNLPEQTLEDNWFIRSFMVRHPSAQTQPIQDFADEYSRHEKYFDTWQAMARAGDLEASERIRNMGGDQNLVLLKGINEGIKAQYLVIRMAYGNPGVPPHQQREIIDQAYSAMTMFAKSGNEMMKQATHPTNPH